MRVEVQFAVSALAMFLLFINLLVGKAEIFALFEADNGMMASSENQISPPSRFDYEEYNHIVSPATPSITSTNVPTSSIVVKLTFTATKQVGQSIGNGTEKTYYSRSTLALGLLFIIFMMILFICLSNINSNAYRRKTSSKCDDIEMVVNRNPLSDDAYVRLDIGNSAIDYTNTRFVPRGVDGSELSIVREVSRELDSDSV